MRKGIVYYTDNYPDADLLETCRKSLLRKIPGFDIVSVSQEPVDFGRNFVLPGIGRSAVSLFYQVLRGLEESKADVVYLIEHDVLYHSSHFDFIPPDNKIFYYNRNRYAVDPDTGKAVFYQTNVLSLLVAKRDLLLKHFARRVGLAQIYGFRSRDGYSPPNGIPKNENPGKYKTFFGEIPCLDIRHDKTFTRKRITRDQFKSDNSCRDWAEAYDLPYWGKFYPWQDFMERVDKEL